MSQDHKIYGDIAIFSGNANPALAKEIASSLGVMLGGADVCQFPNENIFVRLHESVRAKDVFLIQPTCSPVNDNVMELLIMIDTLRRDSAGRITAVVPYYAYGRSDKKDQPRVPITARLIADLITAAGADRVLTVDLHAGQIQGFFTIPTDEVTAFYLLNCYFQQKMIPNLAVVAPDIGAIKRARNFAQRLDVPLAIIEKRRIGNGADTEVLNVIGDVHGCNVVLVDDEIDTGGTLLHDTEALRKVGVNDIYVCATHATLSGDASRRLDESGIKEVIVTNTVAIPSEKQFPTLTVLSIAPFLAEVIHRIHEGTSVGAIYEQWH